MEEERNEMKEERKEMREGGWKTKEVYRSKEGRTEGHRKEGTARGRNGK